MADGSNHHCDNWAEFSCDSTRWKNQQPETFFVAGLDDVRGHKGHGAESKHSSSGSETSSSGHTNGLQQPQQQRRNRAGRVRTVLTEKQLQLLKSCYLANPRPDALMKEQLVEMTGLSPRVVRVWFQNKRCKDKKKMQMKQSKVRL